KVHKNSPEQRQLLYIAPQGLRFASFRLASQPLRGSRVTFQVSSGLPNFPIEVVYLPEPVLACALALLWADIRRNIITTSSAINEGMLPPSTPVLAADSVATNPSTPATENGFAKLGLSAELLRAVTDQGYTVPTPI